MSSNCPVRWTHVEQIKAGDLIRKNSIRAQKNQVNQVNFWITAKPGSRVFVAGTFNNWDSQANSLKENSSRGHFLAVLGICSGRHEYKFVVDDLWQLDPSCPLRVANPFGSENNVLQVEKPDIEKSELAHQIEILGIN